jgi:endonuclease VIII
MPEGDVIRRTSTRLQQALAGRELVSAELRWPGLSTARLRGCTVTEVTAYGKHLLTRLDTGWTLHSHLRMDGQWVIEATGPPHLPPVKPRRSARNSPQARAILANAEWTAIGLSLGMLNLVRTAEEHTLIGHLGPDILQADFDQAQAVRNLAGCGTSIGVALLEQRNLAGIGTFWAAEGLFVRRLHPWRPTAELSAAELSDLLTWIRRTMQISMTQAAQTSTGHRRHGETSFVHARARQPCRRCGTLVAVASIGPPTRQRPLYFCPACQPE